jgi:hypothetical protein
MTARSILATGATRSAEAPTEAQSVARSEDTPVRPGCHPNSASVGAWRLKQMLTGEKCVWPMCGLPALDVWISCMDQYPVKDQTGHMTTTAQSVFSGHVCSRNNAICDRAQLAMGSGQASMRGQARLSGSEAFTGPGRRPVSCASQPSSHVARSQPPIDTAHPSGLNLEVGDACLGTPDDIVRSRSGDNP